MNIMNRFRIIISVAFLLFGFFRVQAQDLVVKTDLTNWATLSLNVEPEVRVGKKSTLALGISYNPWTFAENRKWRHLRVQPEYRYWICRPFGGHFLGLHASYTRFNVGRVDFPGHFLPALAENRVQGNEWAVGIGYGYHWILSTRWSFEAEVGLGFSHADFDEYRCETCGDYLGSRHTNRFMPTKLSLSFIYVIR